MRTIDTPVAGGVTTVDVNTREVCHLERASGLTESCHVCDTLRLQKCIGICDILWVDGPSNSTDIVEVQAEQCEN